MDYAWLVGTLSHRRLVCGSLLIGIVAVGCAEGTDDALTSSGGSGPGGSSSTAGAGGTSPGGGGPGPGPGGSGLAGGSGGAGASGGGGGIGGGGVTAHQCPADQFAIGVDENGFLDCAPLGSIAQDAIEAGCSLYYGWRDSCNGCTTAPSRWGRVSGTLCQNGLGSSNSCTVPNLGGKAVELFGLNTGGDVGGDDKFYIGFHCPAQANNPTMGPCPAGSYVSSIDAGVVSCKPMGPAIVDYVRSSCRVYYGWRDSCDGCATPPLKWGSAGETCASGGVTTDNTCTTPSLGGTIVSTYGLSTDGDVNDDDKFYIGMHCDDAAMEGGEVATACPDGQFVMGIAEDGSLVCQSPAPLAQTVMQDECFLYSGWRDSCGSCLTAPSRWGRVSQNECFNGLGTTNTCAVATLGTTPVRLFGLNTGGDVDDNDKFYLGMSCK